ncbi:hypothetical protein SAICODRAFT_37443 [Saitoella complicata NRRL Y-17804]|uniref:uncharacterized protein n=1 Tax=Saitoella complicata (strain BCRC 22490 / CBS 7301 / JCM 7358 / NBRC 10748 / NRRL Y-17804) TaxID=698492 RepID=UPI000867C7E2|nr:uncharacterized protein SAICODRAFT_37443 [Saitoella complicata NRRL Y-17804]ODQ50181.1 hypothetical protein SAICODRAFT_37443 [Saitoella complicata NRRL Y-17804]
MVLLRFPLETNQSYNAPSLEALSISQKPRLTKLPLPAFSHLVAPIQTSPTEEVTTYTYAAPANPTTLSSSDRPQLKGFPFMSSFSLLPTTSHYETRSSFDDDDNESISGLSDSMPDTPAGLSDCGSSMSEGSELLTPRKKSVTFAYNNPTPAYTYNRDDYDRSSFPVSILNDDEWRELQGWRRKMRRQFLQEASGEKCSFDWFET